MSGEWIVPGFRHVRQLGDGASGIVMQAIHLETGRPVAIKYLSPRLLEDEEFLERFREEARILSEIEDPGLVAFHEYVESPHGAAIIMELVDGVSLAQLINSEGPTGPEAALYVLKGSLLGLAAAHHAGVVHRDYKPGNIIVDGDGNSHLVDFGVAVRAGDNVPFSGTPAYMPPEQWGGRPVTPATDVYAATAVFYECLTGQQPYPARTLPQLALAHRTAAIPSFDVPEPLRPLVAHGLAKDLGDRPQSAHAFLSELEAIAFAAYGVGWEERGRNTLKERALILAMLFPLSNRADATGAVGMGATALGDGDFDGNTTPQAYDEKFYDFEKRRRAPKKSLLVGAAIVIAILAAGGGTAAVVVGNTGNTTASAATHTPTPTTSAPVDSGSPTDSPTSTPTSPSPSPTTTATSTPNTAATTPAAAANPTPTPTKTSAKPTPTKTSKSPTPKTTPFQVVSVNVSFSQPNSDGVGDYTVTVKTQGSPAGTVTITMSSATVKLTSPTGSASSGFTGRYTGGYECRADFTITATASPGAKQGSATYTVSNDPNCQVIG